MKPTLMDRLTFLFAILIALGIVIVCVISSPLADVLIPAPPTPTLSTTSSVPVTNAELHASFKQPEGWVLINSGILKYIPDPVQYATYGLKGQTNTPTFTITKNDFGLPGPWDELVRSVAKPHQEDGADILEELYETIDGLPAGGVRYRKKGEVGFELMVSQRGQTHLFRWSSEFMYVSQLEQIYQAMLPTIKFEPPPTSVDTYLPLRPTRQTEIILGTMLSPELKAVVRGALSTLKACSPEMWSFVHQYAYAINTTPYSQMNYHMIRYAGVILLSQTDLLRWSSKSLREFAAMSAIVHGSRHLWQDATHFIAQPDALERDAYLFELQVFDEPACVATVPREDRANLAIMRRTVEQSIKNPPPVPP